MAKAMWQNVTVAESAHTEQVEGNHYFPPSALQKDYLRPSEHTTVCPWKGTAHYHDVVIDGQTNSNAAWYYPEPKPAAENIRGYVAFWKGITVQG